jgi:predicted ATPase
MVGRERELATLRSAFDRAGEEETCILVTVLGTPGVGKSRLVHEFLADVRPRATVLRGRCLPYGEGITWLPVADLLRSAVGAAEGADGATVLEPLAALLAEAPEADALLARLAQPLGVPGEPVALDELVWAVRRFVERLAQARPVVVVLDDLQWAEETLLDLVEHLADWITSVPVLLVMMARPELLDLRSGWGGGKPNVTTFRLEPLPPAETEQLVDELLAGAALPGDARARLAAAADGNPLYVEQVVEVLLDDGALRRAPDGSLEIGSLDAITVPPTMQALLAARLDRLDDAERRTIERAAVVGKEFRRMEVLELTPEPIRDGVPTQLRALVRKELTRPDGNRQLDLDETYRFRHLLIRDAAYESLPKSERAELHERFADWLEASGQGRLAELDEIVGYHLDQARAYRLDLAPDDARTRVLALRAGRRLASAGTRAIERSEPLTAARLLQRAEGLLAEDPRARFGVLTVLTDALWATQDANAVLVAARKLEAIATGLGEIAVLRARLATWTARAFTDPAFVISDHHADAAAAVAVFEAAGDVDGLLDADGFELSIALNQGRWRDVEHWAELGMRHARPSER